MGDPRPAAACCWCGRLYRGAAPGAPTRPVSFGICPDCLRQTLGPRRAVTVASELGRLGPLVYRGR
jgi:hypothetical protein